MENFILSNKERKIIFKLLSENKRMAFNEIQKETGLRSNKLSYQLNLMKDKEFIEDKEGTYSLTIEAQRLIPYFSQIFKKEVGVLPVILAIIINDEKILLINRKKMPYKGYWSVPGGKQINGETIPETIIREVKEETNIDAEFIKYNSVVYERLRENGRFKHSFLFIICTLKAKNFNAIEKQEGAVAWFNLKEVLAGKINIIPSDLEFIQRYYNKSITIDHIIQDENEDKITLI